MINEKWIFELNQVTEVVKKIFGDLTSEQINWRPAPDRWSIAQNLQHLITVNSSYFPVIQSVRDGTYRRPWTGRIGLIARFLDHAVLKGVQPDRRNKTKTFSIWEPGTSDLPADIVGKFVRNQEELKKLIRDSEDLLDRGTVISSPANRMD